MSKYLFVGYDTTYLDFFSSMERGILSKNPDALIQHIYIRPGAYFFASFTKNNTLTPFFSRFIKLPKKLKKTSHEDLDLSFYLTSESVNVEFLENIYDKYLQWIEKYISTELSGAIIIMPGEYRLFEQALLSVIDKEKTKVLYFESGPPGYIYLSKSGVNANADFSKSGFSYLARKYKKYVLNFQPKSIEKPIKSKKLLSISKIIDLFFYTLMMFFSKLGDHEEFLLSFYKRFKLYFLNKIYRRVKGLKSEGYSEKYYLFLGQVKEDINSTHFGLDEKLIVESLLEIVKKSKCTVLLKPHPLQELSKEVKDLCVKHPLIFKYDSGSLNLKETIINSNGVITVNSNGGLESLLLGKPILVLGRSYYDSCYGVVKSAKELVQFIHNRKAITESALKFISDCFIPIDYRSKNMSNAQILGEMIESEKL